MYKKCEKCYENSKNPSNTDCEKCDTELKRKTQECEQKERELLNNEKIINKLIKQLDQLNAETEEQQRKHDYYKQIVDGCLEVRENGFCQIDFENEQLKIENEQLKIENEQLKETVDNLLKIQYKLADTSNKYSQKLEKIREFATALCYRAITDGVVILQEDILQIIEEVE